MKEMFQKQVFPSLVPEFNNSMKEHSPLPLAKSDDPFVLFLRTISAVMIVRRSVLSAVLRLV